MSATVPVERRRWSENCEKLNADILTSKKFVLMYEKNKKNQRCGVAIAWRDVDGVKFGWSKCNPVEPFDKHIGIRKAISRNLDLVVDGPYFVHSGVTEVPRSTKKVLIKVLDKAREKL